MATKRTRSAREAPAEQANAASRGLRHSETPGVFLNSANIPCDSDGVALSFLQVKARDDAHHAEVIGEPADTPVKYLKSVALDPRMPTHVRMEAAKSAAPYTDRKQPIAVDGGVNPETGSTLPFIDMSAIPKMPTERLKLLYELLEEAALLKGAAS